MTLPTPVMPYSPDYEWARQKGELVTVEDLTVKYACSRQMIRDAIHAGELSAFKAEMSGDSRGTKYYVFADSAAAWPGPKRQGGQPGAMRVPITPAAASRGGLATKVAREADPEACDTSTCAACSMRRWCHDTDPAMPWRRRARVLWRAMSNTYGGTP